MRRQRVRQQKTLRHRRTLGLVHGDAQTQAGRPAAIAHALTHLDILHAPDRGVRLRDHFRDDCGGLVVLARLRWCDQRQHFGAGLAHKLGVPEEIIRRANILIRKLNPRPGSQFSDAQARYVVADVITRKVNGKWIASIHPQALPNIQINQIYADALQRDRSGNGPLTRHLQEARWLIRNVQQRFETIQRVAQVIVDRQRRFLELGELAMRPLMLRDVARELGLHPSTISRVTSNKYMETPSGLIELKRFFSSRLTNDEDGSSCSSTAIRALIRELIAAESPANPLSDVQIARILASRSIKVARRTVAKYRTALRIPSVEARRMAVSGVESTRSTPPRPIAALASERRWATRNQPQSGTSAANDTPPA